ncbi:unnamed protein product [Effrenium voratum]|nr:unnamed protein product [Effrenium voratum]
MSTPSVATAVAYGAILDVKDKHSLYVSNLSVTVTENTLREIFHSCGKLDQVIFRTYPGSLKWYAQLNFRTSEGVVEASKLEGTAICGCAIKCSAVDPTCFAAHQVIEELKAKEDATEKAKEELEAARQEWYKKLQEHKEARKKRTVHVDGLPPQTTLQELQQLAEQFGTVEQLRLDRDAKGGAFGLVQFKDQSVARGCCLRQTFLVDEHVVVISASKSEVNSMDIEEATVEFRHPVIERALASTGGRESNAGAPQGKFWEELAEKQRQLYNEKLDQVRQHAEAILGPGVVPAPAPAASPPPEEDFFAWAKQAAAFFEPTPEAIAAEAAEEEPQKGPVDIEEHPDIVPGTELAVLQDSSSEEISDEDHENEVELAGGFFADGPRAQRQRRAALRRRAAKERGLARAAKAKAKAIPSPAQWAAARAVALERLQNSPAQWAAARARALERLKTKAPSALTKPPARRRKTGEVQLSEIGDDDEIVMDLDVALDLTQSQICILRTVKSTGAQYALWSHGKLALAAGVPEEVVRCLSDGGDPRKECGSLLREENAALALCDELLKPGMAVSEETYASAKEALGECFTFEVATTVGFYLLLSASPDPPAQRLCALDAMLALVAGSLVTHGACQCSDEHRRRACGARVSDLITPTDASASGRVLMQLSSLRDPWDSAASTDSSKTASYLSWQLLYFSHGNRALLEDGSSEGGTLGILLTCFTVLLAVCVCLCAWRSAPEPGPKLPPGPSMRPTLEPSKGRPSCLSPIPQAPSEAERSENSEPSALPTATRVFSGRQVCCPDLMVPRGSQSVLGVPSLKEQRAQLLDVVDPIGMPILKVEVLRAQDPSPRVSLIQSASSPGSAILPPGATRRPLLALRNLRPEGLDRRLGNEPNAMAVAFQRGEALEICTPELSIFGVLEKEESPMGLRFVLRVGSEAVTSIIFQGTSVHSGLAVTDAANKILARTQAGRLKFEAGGRFYSLQVHAGVDVGVLLCCLLFIDGLGAGLF